MNRPTPDFCERCQLPRSMCEHRGTVSMTMPLRTGDPNLQAALGLQVPGFWAECSELAEQGDTADAGPVIASRYHGTCRANPDHRWEPGDLIAFDQDEDAWVCAQCAG